MKQKTVATILVVALVSVAGCSAIFGSAEFETTVDGPETVATDEQFELDVTVSNTGDDSGEHDVEFVVGGETTTETVELGDGNETTLSFTHTFAEPGEKTLEVDGETVTVDVIEPLAAIRDSMDDVSTYTASTEQDVTISFDEKSTVGEPDLIIDQWGEDRVNIEDEEMYRAISTEDRTSIGFGNKTTEEWYVDGKRYTRERSAGQFSDTGITYESSDISFDEAIKFGTGTGSDGYLSVLGPEYRGETAQSYIYTISSGNRTVFKEFISSVDESVFERDNGELQDFEITVTADKETHRVSEIDLRMQQSTTSENQTADATIGLEYSITYDAYDTDIDAVEVPDDVTNATESSAEEI